MPRPHFTIKNRFQKRLERYSEVLTPDVLRDVCHRICGRDDYTVHFEEGVNVGRLAKLDYAGRVSYISFSETGTIGARNSSFQSFPSAVVKFHQEHSIRKGLFFYFLPSVGNIETPYFLFMYRLMKTAGCTFLNDHYLTRDIHQFSSVEDIVAHRNVNRQRNRANRSTYVTVDEDNVLQVYGKTYGASKYETTLLCFAISAIASQPVELFEIREGNLKKLPADAREAITALGKIKIFTSDLTIERDALEFRENDSLRSPTFIYNLLEKFGDKQCAFCHCSIPELIQGAHIWPVSDIKKSPGLSRREKLQMALDRENGIWLCNNHHKLFDIGLLMISQEGQVRCKSSLRSMDEEYIHAVTVKYQIPLPGLTSNFLRYLGRRNRSLNTRQYGRIPTLL